MKQQELVEALQRNFESGIVSVYKDLKSGFFSFAKRYTKDVDIISQSYHDAIIGFIEIWNQGKYEPNRAQLNTLIYTIGRNQILKSINKKGNRTLDIENVYDLQSELKHIETSELQQNMRKALLGLGPKCQEIIKLFYYYNYSNEAIMHRMNYENENTVKAHKSRCLRKLRTLTSVKKS